MDIIQIIENDHDEIESLISEAKTAANNNSKRSQLLKEIQKKLTAHNEAEEYLLYSRLKKEGEKGLAMKSTDEHELAMNYFEKFKEDLNEDEFLGRLAILENLLSTHIEEEETITLPQLKALLSSDELKSLADKFTQEKEKHLNK